MSPEPAICSWQTVGDCKLARAVLGKSTRVTQQLLPWNRRRAAAAAAGKPTQLGGRPVQAAALGQQGAAARRCRGRLLAARRVTAAHVVRERSKQCAIPPPDCVRATSDRFPFGAYVAGLQEVCLADRLYLECDYV